jgi:hypothetical protein
VRLGVLGSRNKIRNRDTWLFLADACAGAEPGLLLLGEGWGGEEKEGGEGCEQSTADS